MKRLVRDIVVLVIAIASSLIFKIEANDLLMGTVFTISGIMFSIGLSILATFNLHGIRKRSIVSSIRYSLRRLRNIYLLYFIIGTIIFVLEGVLRRQKANIIEICLGDDFVLHSSVSVIALILLFYSIVYFVLNFIQIQELNDEVFDKSADE